MYGASRVAFRFTGASSGEGSPPVAGSSAGASPAAGVSSCCSPCASSPAGSLGLGSAGRWRGFIGYVVPPRSTRRGLSVTISSCSALMRLTKGVLTAQRRAISRSDHCPHSSSCSSMSTARRLSALERRTPWSAFAPAECRMASRKLPWRTSQGTSAKAAAMALNRHPRTLSARRSHGVLGRRPAAD